MWSEIVEGRSNLWVNIGEDRKECIRGKLLLLIDHDMLASLTASVPRTLPDPLPPPSAQAILLPQLLNRQRLPNWRSRPIRVASLRYLPIQICGQCRFERSGHSRHSHQSNSHYRCSARQFNYSGRTVQHISSDIEFRLDFCLSCHFDPNSGFWNGCCIKSLINQNGRANTWTRTCPEGLQDVPHIRCTHTTRAVTPINSSTMDHQRGGQRHQLRWEYQLSQRRG